MNVSTPDLPPGPELDRAVADAMGMVPCDGWERSNLGSAGGPIIIGTDCYHAPEACWSTVTNGPGVGGLPAFSTDRRFLSLDLLSPGWSLVHGGPELWYIVPLPSPEVHFATLTFAMSGTSEAHVLALTYLRARTANLVEPRFTEETRWRSWKEHAERFGVLDRPEWTPPHVHRLLELSRCHAWLAIRDPSAIDLTGSEARMEFLRLRLGDLALEAERRVSK